MQSLILSFKMCSSKLDILLEISVVRTCVSLNKMNVYWKNWKIKNQSVQWFGFTELNKTMGIMFGRNNSKT